MQKHVLFLVLTTLALLSFSEKSNHSAPTTMEEGTITNLYDAFGKDTALIKDFGFSCLVRYHGKSILFDAGSNADIFKSNVKQLGIDLAQIDMVVVSHGHFDHLNGIDYLLKVHPKVKIYFPNDFFWGAPAPFDATGQEADVKDSLPVHMRYFDGGPTKFAIQQSGRFWGANIEFVKNSKEALPGLQLITTNSEYMGYFSCYPNKSFVEGQFEEKDHACRNINLPELSMAMKTERGQVLIVGCSHTGVEKIVAETAQVTHDKIELVYGGFHMLPFDRKQTGALVNLLKNDLKVRRVAPAHCTGHLAFQLLQQAYGSDYLYAGLGETILFDGNQ